MKTIDPKEFYTAHEIHKNGFFPWAKSMRSVINWIEKDRQGRNLLGSQKYGEETGTRYLIKGENLINFIANFEDGSLEVG